MSSGVSNDESAITHRVLLQRVRVRGVRVRVAARGDVARVDRHPIRAAAAHPDRCAMLVDLREREIQSSRDDDDDG